MSKGYVAYNLTSSSREKILSSFTPKFTKVIAHHITLAFGVDSSYPLPSNFQAKVVGYSNNENIECLVVEIAGNIYRPDGKVFHITLSHNEKAKPVDSNILLATKGYSPVSPFEIEVVPTFNAFN